MPRAFSDRAVPTALFQAATMCVGVLYVVSFALPAYSSQYVDVRGYEAAWSYLKLPFQEPPRTLSNLGWAVLLSPTNLLLVASFALILTGRRKMAWLLAGYALVGQLSFVVGFRFSELGSGYWAWVASGAMLFAISFRLRHRVD